MVYAEVSLCRRACTRSSSWSVRAPSPGKRQRAAVEKAASSLRDLRIAEVTELDLQLEGGVVKAYRAKVKVSFKYED
jgi:dodecin